MRPRILIHCLAITLLSGCAGRLGPVKSNAPAAWLLVRNPIVIAAGSGPATPSRFIAADRSSFARTVSSCAAGPGSGANLPTNPGPTGPGFHYKFPPGKYLLAGQDRIGFYYGAPESINVAGTLYKGGIYWPKASIAPDSVYYYDDPESPPCIKYVRELSGQDIIPQSH
jgi:hypothetical protein